MTQVLFSHSGPPLDPFLYASWSGLLGPSIICLVCVRVQCIFLCFCGTIPFFVVCFSCRLLPANNKSLCQQLAAVVVIDSHACATKTTISKIFCPGSRHLHLIPSERNKNCTDQCMLYMHSLGCPSLLPTDN